MPQYTTTDIRNISLVGHGGSGKTSLAEALLLHAGSIHQLGQVEKGNTVSDNTDEEKAHLHSLFSSVLNLNYQGKRINLIDTPGFADFQGQALASLAAVETAAVVISASAGIEQMARRMMQRAKELNLCRMIIINKMDAENVDLESLVEQIREAFGRECLPVNLPAQGRTAVIDCFTQNQGDSDLGPVADAHTQIIDQIVEVDEDLMALYLEQGEVKPEQLHQPFEKALREGHLVPICFVSARHHTSHDKSIGLEELLEAFVRLCPNPLEGNIPTFSKGTGDAKQAVPVAPDPAKPVVAHVFKVVNDRFGKMGVFRIHQGTIKKDTQLYVGANRKPTRIAHLYTMQGGQHTELDTGIAGDICAVIKVEEVHYDAILHEDAALGDLHFDRIKFPEPMYGLAIESKKRGDEQKIGDAMTKLVDEDPTFRVKRDSITHETVIHGLGELHLRVVLEKLKGRYGIEVDTRPPKIAYRETISIKAEGHHRHKKQTGGAGQFGEVYLRVEPLERGSGFEFVDDTFGGSIPNQFIPAVEKGVRQVLDLGAIAGYPLQDVRVSVYDGKYHPVDSKEVAFVTAGKRAFIDAIQKAKPVLLEPCVKIEVTVPNQYMGDITGDLSGKRGRIQGTDMIGHDTSVIKALVPLAEVSNYQNQLKSVTGGQGSYNMEFSHYDPVPGMIQQQIMAQYKPKVEED
ncbi:MAG: elongation factor G [Phycisphaeraceae bacterium]|nr:elongation factor G [Phycisphaeraceae bacterium]